MIDTYSVQASCINPDRKIEVYRNLHKDCWSVRQKGIVRFHCNLIKMHICEFIVQPAGRAKVLREKKKNVHAFIRGYLWEDKHHDTLAKLDQKNCFIWDDIHYNPYKADTFVDFAGEPVYSASFADLSIKDKKTPVLALLE